jgi:proline iminopeptidase
LGKNRTSPEAAAASFGVGQLTRHLFLCAGPDCADPDEGERVADAMLADGLSVNFECNRLTNAETSALDPEALLDRCRRLEVPALILHGSEDTRPAEGVRSLVEALPNARMLVIEGAGHLPWVERPEVTAEAMNAFLRDVL